MARILHTSDWHLGAWLEGNSREAEHGLFLSWLLDELRTRAIDVLIIAGDVFDQTQPSAEAQRLYYRFLSQIVGTGLKKVIVVGGNHDSPSRLDAPAEILAALDVHVVGGMSGDLESRKRCLCEVKDSNGVTELVIAAIPFFHEYRLGVRTAQRAASEIRKEFEEKFGEFYKNLADDALALGNGVPIVATGHLASGECREDDAPAAIHMIGTIGALSAKIFDERFAYVALGHIHRSYRVSESQAWYCGSPVALTLKEMKPNRNVLVVDTGKIEDGRASVERVVVPTFRQIIEIRGDVETVTSKLRNLQWDTPLAPIVFTVVDVEHFRAGIDNQIIEAVAANPIGRVSLAQPRQFRKGLEQVRGVVPRATLRDLRPMEVFERLCADKNEPLDEELRAAFSCLLSECVGAGDQE